MNMRLAAHQKCKECGKLLVDKGLSIEIVAGEKETCLCFECARKLALDIINTCYNNEQPGVMVELGAD